GFNTYPVVGVNWHQANEYCKWRSAKVNQKVLEKNPDASPSTLWPNYRLPTEAEWEYAARGLLEQENYPWEGKSLRDAKGRLRANFKLGRGDYAGRSDKGGSKLITGLNDAYMICAPVKAFYPNDFGLYNMAGNVAEWTLDTYRQLSYEDVEDLNPHRRRGKTERVVDQVQDDIKYDKLFSILHHVETTVPDRMKNNGPYVSFATSAGADSEFDNVKVYRGGSWQDVAYYLTPGSRRFYNADSSSCTIGFRCAMIRVGSPF
ncbi:MAG: SUMF1/EgtB/PvdO family nonheme iron enzyme, partial [Bacteroidia bacterium]|nr:SUMF1/EgtB/PvdO family nonheme iron enzyme [Bacteroidia bacterium]